MDFRSAQERAWQNKLAKGFDTTDVPVEFCLLSGEVAEAFDAWRKDRADAGEELADAAIYLLGLAEMTGVDLQAEVEAKLAKNAEREYERVPGGALVKSAPEADRQADGHEPGEGASRLDHPAQRQARWMGHHIGLVAPEPEVTDTAHHPQGEPYAYERLPGGPLWQFSARVARDMREPERTRAPEEGSSPDVIPAADLLRQWDVEPDHEAAG